MSQTPLDGLSCSGQKSLHPVPETETASAGRCSTTSSLVLRTAFPMVDLDRLQQLRPESKRLLASFGIGGHSLRMNVVNEFELPKLQRPVVVLITGASGTGKSQLLRQVLDRCWDGGWQQGVPPVTNALIDAWPDVPQSRVISVLASVGLADAFVWARTPAELSTGQRARFRVAQLLMQKTPMLVIDEFCNELDRVTAKAVAWSATRAVRKAGRSAIFATSIDDVAEAVSADVHIRLGWSPQPEVLWRDSRPSECPLLGELVSERGDFADWNALKPLHYAAGDPSTVHSVHVLRHPDLDQPAAVAVLSYPDLHSAARNLVTRDEYAIRGSADRARRLNREVLKFTRIVVTPELRSCGLTKPLLMGAIERTNARYYECVTAMGKYSKFLAALGFVEVPSETPGVEAEVLDWAERSKVPDDVLLHWDRFAEWVNGLSVRGRRDARRLVWLYYHQFVLHRRTRRGKPKVVPGPQHPEWPEAFALVARRCRERPSYWVLGPVER